MKKRVAVLGATGSIGKSALDVIARDPDRFEVVLLTAHSRADELDKININTKKILTRRHGGTAELISIIKEIQPDITVNGIAGAAGLEPSIAAIEAGSDLALANKETMVMAGDLVLKLAQEKNVKIIPVDSEHSAVFHLLEAFSLRTGGYNPPLPVHSSLLPSPFSLSEIILTASGGPFRNYTLLQMESITLKDALAHPTWNMGHKITIDSASMANKGLEVIEACALFNMPPDKIKVTVHPQSIVHSMIRLTNGIVYAQLSKPDMRAPIADALYYPDISPAVTEPLDFDNLTLNFEKPDTEKFPMLKLAYLAAERGGLYPCVYNAANEEAVSAFINGQCGFLDILKITEFALQKDWSQTCTDIQSVLQADKETRNISINYIKNLVK